MERDPATPSLSNITTDFNSRAHVERDMNVEDVETQLLISTHALTWSATFRNCYAVFGKIDFNSRAHVERDQNVMNTMKMVKISTHALTWSATRSLKTMRDGKLYISTHALTWSATRPPRTTASAPSG